MIPTTVASALVPEQISILQPRAIARVALLVQQHAIFAAPTDTVYGLMCRFADPSAIEGLYIAKGRPPQKAIPVLISDVEQLGLLTPTPLTPVAQLLAERFWPGALTLVLPALPTLPAILTANQPSIGIRLPAYEPLRRLIRQTGPLAATSANISDGANTSTADEVLAQLAGRIPLLLTDDGTPRSATPSTVIDLSHTQEFPRMLRRGELAGAINTALYAVFGYAC
jgi:L-threonylcarbamoyladenylate synthase